MGKIIGRNAEVAISSDGVTYTDIGRVMSAELSTTDDMADCTNNDSGGWKEELAADSQASLDITAKYDEADAGQGILITAKYAKTPYYFRFRPEAGAGVNEWIFQAHIPDLSVSTETGSVEELSASMQSTGSVTVQAQT